MKKRYYFGDAYPEIYFSPCQARCMAYFILGFSNTRVAEVLNLSPRTVDAYTIEMRKKLNCYSKKAMVEKVRQTAFMKYMNELTGESAVLSE